MNAPAIQATQKLPAPAELSRSDLGHVADALREMVSPVIEHGWTMRDATSDVDRLSAARSVVASPIPPGLGEYPSALRAAATENAEMTATTRLVTITLDTRTGFRAADPKAYVASIVSSIVARGFGPRIVQLACGIIRETDPAEFHHAMPSEFHFLQACVKTKEELEATAREIERALKELDHAASIVARASLIEAAEAEAIAKAAARVTEIAERSAAFLRQKADTDAARAAEERKDLEAKLAAERRRREVFNRLDEKLRREGALDELARWKAELAELFFESGAADDWVMWKSVEGIDDFSRREHGRMKLAAMLRRARGS